ncbi:MAG: hypothetical protein H8E55_17320 [Pelagibacterales bacterium]|jgi:hypothetical protein|nr:hypothetical protein [Pelagibacterales bacterium]MDA1009194.1 hypothetical protein [Bacteroidota bacterium]
MRYLTRKDPYTGCYFTPKRDNQKFSCRSNQIAFNNEKARKIRREKKPLDDSLESNRKILENTLGDYEFVIKSYDFLLGAGYIFNVFNSNYNINGVVYQCVYQFALTKLNNNQYKICLIR